MTDTTKLAERIEALEGPCREVDAAIALAVHDWCKPHTPCPKGPQFPLENKYGSPFFPQLYTASLDAAMTLVPEGCFWNLGGQVGDHATADIYGKGVATGEVFAATPALALCAAAIRAQEAHNG